jgi:hypothetical protein
MYPRNIRSVAVIVPDVDDRTAALWLGYIKRHLKGTTYPQLTTLKLADNGLDRLAKRASDSIQLSAVCESLAIHLEIITHPFDWDFPFYGQASTGHKS